ncbi:MAG: L,D-transpeptidase family protein [Methylobacter sp.]|nr:L,D-transpeptidase family protein [Methylobacter sp.]
MLNTAKLYFHQRNAIKLRLLLLLVLGLSAPVGQADNTDVPQTEVSKDIVDIITTKQHPYLRLSNFANRSDDLDSLYKLTEYKLLWLGTDQSQKNIPAALELLSNAAINGLNPTNYDVDGLKSRWQSIQANSNNYKEQALLDTALSISLLRFMHDLHYGRVNPQGIKFNLKLREKKLTDLPALIKTSVDQGTLDQLPKLVEPQLQQYQKLKQALVSYRQLAATVTLFQITGIEKKLSPGDKHPQIPELKRFLQQLGDLPEDNTASTTAKTTIYSDSIVAGVKNFQLRHGLGADGVIGKTTVAALNVPLSQRVTQIELAMERLRWLPEFNAGKSIIVNIPSFQLWAFDESGQLDSTVTNMRVVVGKALENQTPVLMAEMRFIDFMPYWNVPYSIAKQEIIPKLLQNPNYLAHENMELVPVFGNEVQGTGFTGGEIEQIKQGSLRIRQRPGGKNALGRVKFIFPNKDDVYLHDTPANALFSKSRRDFSHGCVRVEKPQLLAEFALKNQEGWDKELIKQALETPKTKRVLLKQPIPVLFFYTTTFFDQFDNLKFYSDIYGHDNVLLEALSKPEDVPDQALFISKNANNVEQPAVVK